MPTEVDIAIGSSVQMTVKEKDFYCTFCYGWKRSNCEMMGEPVCYDCRDKFIERVKLIMNFQ